MTETRGRAAAQNRGDIDSKSTSEREPGATRFRSVFRLVDGSTCSEDAAGFAVSDGSRTVHVLVSGSVVARANARVLVSCNDIRNLHGVGRKSSSDRCVSTLRLDADGVYRGPRASLLRQSDRGSLVECAS